MQPVQLKMARAALDLTIDQLAAKAGVSPDDIRSIENGESDGAGMADRLTGLFADAGVEFIGGDTVRCRVTGTGAAIDVENLNSANDE